MSQNSQSLWKAVSGPTGSPQTHCSGHSPARPLCSDHEGPSIPPFPVIKQIRSKAVQRGKLNYLTATIISSVVSILGIVVESYVRK